MDVDTTLGRYIRRFPCTREERRHSGNVAAPKIPL